jgi:hypothetical protein
MAEAYRIPGGFGAGVDITNLTVHDTSLYGHDGQCNSVAPGGYGARIPVETAMKVSAESFGSSDDDDAG